MGQKRWSLDDIPWDLFDRSRVDPDTVKVVKAASLVERNAHDYARYLGNVFADDPGFRDAICTWGDEEVQHGEALGRWAGRADPDFDFEAAFRRFREAYRIPLEVDRSVRGSRAGEMVARCVVETATSSLYSALRDATDEPVLAFICGHIAKDEFRHYKLFYQRLQRERGREGPGLLRRALVAYQRLNEADDDELAQAFHCANGAGHAYDRRKAGAAYAGRVFRHYRRNHVERAVTMTLRAVGAGPYGPLSALASHLAWRQVQRLGQRTGRGRAPACPPDSAGWS